MRNFPLTDELKLERLNALFGSIVFRPLECFFEITVFHINIQIRLCKLLTVEFPYSSSRKVMHMSSVIIVMSCHVMSLSSVIVKFTVCRLGSRK